MNGQELYDLTTELMDGVELGESVWESLINLARRKRELRRDWQILKKKSTAFSVTPSTTSTTSFTLPSDCSRPVKNTVKTHPIVLLNSGNKKIGTADEILLEHQFDYIDTPGKFYVDYAAHTFYFTGNPPVGEAASAYLFYLRDSGDIEVDTGSYWTPFSGTNGGPDFSALLAYDVAIMQKGDIDYDEVNARMVQFSGVSAQSLETSMIMWDERIKLSALGV